MVIEALFPKFCLSCGHEGQNFCFTCMQNWIARPEPAACPFCGMFGSDRTCDACQKENYLDGLVHYLPYGNPIVRKLIGLWKYDGDRSVEPVLKQWLAQDMVRLRPPVHTFVVVPVPIHASRKRSRGFDQADVLAGWIGEQYNMPVACLLKRSQKTKPQAKQQHDVRRVGSLDGIFEIHRFASEIPESVVLCDDVFTSGATMDAAAKCLKEAGVKEVWGFVIGKGASN